jgi:hypothetical protein
LLTGNNLKKDVGMGPTLVSDLRIATTAALAGGAGLVLDTAPFEQSLRKGARVNPAAATEENITDTYDIDFSVVQQGRAPIILSQNEGILIRNRTVWPAAGTGVLIVAMDWVETVNK